MGDWYVSVLHKHNQSICKHLNTNIYVIPSYLLSIVEYRDHRIRENVNDMQFFLLNLSVNILTQLYMLYRRTYYLL